MYENINHYFNTLILSSLSFSLALSLYLISLSLLQHDPGILFLLMVHPGYFPCADPKEGQRVLDTHPLKNYKSIAKGFLAILENQATQQVFNVGHLKRL